MPETSTHAANRRSARRRVPRAEREQEMLAAAGRAFAERGFHAVSMDEIAEAAGISKPMLYNYFGSKEGLYVAYVRQAGQALLAQMREAGAPTDAPVDQRLWAGVLAFLTYVDDHRSGWSVLYKEATTHGGPLAAEVAGLRAQIAGMVGVLFDRAPGADGPWPAASEAFAHAFVGAGESLANWWLEHPDEPKERVARLLISLAPVPSSSARRGAGSDLMR